MTRGKTKTEEHKRKLSAAMKGRPSHFKNRTYEEIYGEEKAAELRRMRAESQIGRKASKESRRKNSEAQRGRIITEEHRAKISASMKEYWRRRKLDE